MDKKRGRIQCWMNGCNSFYVKDSGVSFFRFPADPDRSLLWVQASGCADLIGKSSKELFAKYRICSKHFSNNMFLNDLRNRLQSHAVPVVTVLQKPLEEISESYSEQNCKLIWNEEQFQEPTMVISQNESFMKISDASTLERLSEAKTSSSTSHSPRKDVLRQNIKTLRLENRSLQKKIEHMSSQQFEQLIDKFLPTKLASFVKLQYYQHKKKAQGYRYSKELKQFFLSIYFKGPKAYKSLSKTFYLPCKKSLHSYISQLKFSPGLNDAHFQSLKIKVEQFQPLDKCCIMCIGEMVLKSNLFYNSSRDEVIGLEDVGKGKAYKPACHVAVIMLRGIYSDWQQPIGYFLIHKRWLANDMPPVIVDCITRSKAIGLHIRALVTDMRSNFINLSNILQVTPDEPFFKVNNEKIFYLFDTSHLMQATKNDLMNNCYTNDSKATSWEYIKQFYEADSKLQPRLVPQLSQEHIYPSNCKNMKANYAIEVLSAKVSAGLCTYIALGALPESALFTAEFIERLRKLFDILNSSNLKSNKFNRAFTGSEFQVEFLNETLEYFNSVKCFSENGTDVTNKTNSLRCWKVSIRSLIFLWDDLKNRGFNFLLTRRLNQDALENMFANARQRTSNACNPTSMQFYNTYRKIFCANFLQSRTSNCTEDFDVILNEINNVAHTFRQQQKSEDEETPLDLSLNDYDYRNDDIFTKNSITYISEYLIKKCVAIHSCDVCIHFSKENTELNSSNLYHACEQYTPATSFVQMVQKLENSFFKNFSTLCLQQNVVESFIKMFSTLSFNHPCSQFPHAYFIKLYTRLRLFFTLKVVNRVIKRKRKIIILQH